MTLLSAYVVAGGCMGRVVQGSETRSFHHPTNSVKSITSLRAHSPLAAPPVALPRLRYPKEKDVDPGRALFDHFRPCYIRAYADARDIMDSGGKVIEGTKKSTAVGALVMHLTRRPIFHNHTTHS